MTDPRNDPQLRWDAQHSVNDVMDVARDVLLRCSDRTGAFDQPDPIGYGDVTGLIRASETRVLDRLQEAIDRARVINADIRAAVDAHQHELYGDHWRPPPSAAA